MKRLVILVFFAFVFCKLQAQEFSDTLKIERNFWGYYQNDYQLKISDLLEAV